MFVCPFVLLIWALPHQSEIFLSAFLSDTIMNNIYLFILVQLLAFLFVLQSIRYHLSDNIRPIVCNETENTPLLWIHLLKVAKNNLKLLGRPES